MSARHLRSPSVRLGLTLGLLTYACYGFAHDAFANPVLIALSAFIGGFVPYYARLSNRIEERIALRTASVSPARAGRFAAQFAFNVAVFAVLVRGGVVGTEAIRGLGGPLGVALLTTCASQGLQYVALAFANRDVGDRNRNVLVALSLSIVATAVATLGWPWAHAALQTLGLACASLFFGVGLLSDLRARLHPHGGVGVFFGTFNPIHRTHLALMTDALSQRGLTKVYIHCTNVPRLHAQALARGEIRIARRDAGMRVYERTERADVHVNYFPTGNRFYEYETRLTMMRAAVDEAGLSDRVEVLSLPELYDRGGFYAVLAEVRRRHPGVPVHGIHGSDLGGMAVRSIYDESGWIHPFPVVRRDGVSATAIRNGAAGMTAASVQRMIDALRRPPEPV